MFILRALRVLRLGSGPVSIALALAAASGYLAAQETKPVPKDSVRVFVPGCSKGRVFTAGPRSEEHPGNVDIPEGTHIRMNGPKKLMEEIKAHEGSTIEITGLMKKGQYLPGGMPIGGGVRIMPAQPSSGGMMPSPGAGQLMIDVEGWRAVAGSCPGR